MNISPAKKYLDKLKGWAKHEGMIAVETPEAMDEFLPDQNRVPEIYRDAVRKLFNDWFGWERRFTRPNMTLLDFFIDSQKRKLKIKDIEILRRFGAEGTFGFFAVDSVERGMGMTLKRLPDGKIFRVIEVLGSEQAGGGEFMIARLVPFEDHWAIASLIAVWPENASNPIEESLVKFRGTLKPSEIKPRHCLKLFIPKTDWHLEGLPRVKARLSMILQQWNSKITVSQVERDITEAHSKREFTHPLFKVVLADAPSAEDAEDAVELLTAFWNLTLPPEAQKGPIEQKIFSDMTRFVMTQFTNEEMKNQKAVAKKARMLSHEWLNRPQKELKGRTPLEIVLEERRSLGNPREDLETHLIPTPIDIGDHEERGYKLVVQGIELIKAKKPAEALEALQKAYPLIKRHPENFRAFGNMATAYVMLGQREEAIKMLRTALRANPDYSVARNNLHLLENLTSEEFKLKHESGFFEQINFMKEH